MKGSGVAKPGPTRAQARAIGPQARAIMTVKQPRFYLLKA